MEKEKINSSKEMDMDELDNVAGGVMLGPSTSIARMVNSKKKESGTETGSEGVLENDPVNPIGRYYYCCKSCKAKYGKPVAFCKKCGGTSFSKRDSSLEA